jgi:UDPglucose--hexose-1-phosphate uridylyltransferase
VPIKFRKIQTISKFLDARKDYEEKTLSLEHRIDPLTKDMGLVRDLRFKNPLKTDLSPIIAKSLERGCPFCTETINTVTPKFIPELCPDGRITVGEATVFPNAAPYMQYSAVTVICSSHFVGLSEFSPPILSDALRACQDYLRMVHTYDPRAKYCGIMWNYLPPANSSQVHPHLQVFAGRFPMVYHKKLLDASKRYHRRNGTIFWSELIEEEKRLQERYIGTVGSTVWLASFVPRSFQLDVRAIFQNNESILSLSSQDFQDLARGLVNVFKYMDDQNHYSFNMFIYSGISGEKSFWTHARVIQRGPLPPMDISDAGNATLLGDTRMSIRSPEFICEELRPFF